MKEQPLSISGHIGKLDMPDRGENNSITNTTVCQPRILSERPMAFMDAGVAQLVEHQLPKLRVASSSLVARSIFSSARHRS